MESESDVTCENYEEESLTHDKNTHGFTTSDVNTISNVRSIPESIDSTDSKEENTHGFTTSDVNTISNVHSIPESIDSTDSKEEWLDLLGTGHIKKKILRASPSKIRPERSDLCKISYLGCLDDDSFVESAEDIQIHIGDLEVIHGVDMVLALMDLGEQAEVIIGPRFGYGTLGLPPRVPPNATLKYIVTLSSIENEPPLNEVHIHRRIEFGRRKKDRGNWWYSREEYAFAIQCYRRAVDYLDDTDLPEGYTDDEFRILIMERIKTYNNLALAQMKIHAWDSALISVTHVLSCQPNNTKAVYRKARILKEKGNIEGSIEILRKGLSFDRNSPSLNMELANLLAIQRKNNSKDKYLFKRMLGNKKTKDQSKSEKVDSSSSFNSPWRWFLAVSIAVAVVGVFAVKYKY